MRTRPNCWRKWKASNLSVNQVVAPRGSGEARSLSLGQERLWFLDQVTPGSPVYHVPYVSKLRGSVDVNAFQKALNAIVERHEVLRTAVLPIRGAPRPVLLKKWNLPFQVCDLRSLSLKEREIQLKNILTQCATNPFDWVRDVLLRSALIRMADEEYLFVHTAPHMSFEGSSISVLYRELSCLYEAFAENRPSPLPGLDIQYADFAAWQRRFLTGERLKNLSEFWRGNLANAPVIDLPYDFPRPPVLSTRGRRHFFTIDPKLLLRAQSVFSRCGTSRYCGLLSAFFVFLHCCTGMTDFSTGSPFRPRCTGIENLIGFFVNTVVVRSGLSRQATFREILALMGRNLQNAIAHCDLTFDKVVEAVQPDRDPGRGPLFQVNFRAPKEPYPRLQLPGVIADRAQYLDNGTAKFDLALEIDSSLGEACYFEYSTDLFTEETIQSAIVDIQNVLISLIEEPETPIEHIAALQQISHRIQARR
jgi:hypothetical protein